MSQKWNLQDIRPAQKKAPSTSETATRTRKELSTRKRIEETEPTRTHKDPEFNFTSLAEPRSKKKVIIVAILAILLIGGGFLVNMLMGGAVLTVYPKYKDVAVQGEFTASTQPLTGELGYELLTLEATGERQVTATGQEEVTERAMGNITVYNNSNSSQRLIKNTRFESPDGLIFRINESIEVPGATDNGTGSKVPGSAQAQVFADGTGEKYNVAPTRFAVPGLKGSEQYDLIYGESKVPFTGGFEGTKFIIDETELAAKKDELHTELQSALRTRLESEKPAGFIVYPNAVTFAYDSLPSTESGTEQATIKEKARLQVPLFSESEFSKYIAKKTLAGYENDDVIVTDPSALTFAYTSATTSTTDIAVSPVLNFSLKGNVRIVWTFDEDKLKSEIASLPKTALPNVLSGYNAIQRAEATIHPFWSHSFPDNIKKITVVQKLDETRE